MRANSAEQVGVALVVRAPIRVVALLVVAASRESRTGDLIAVRLAAGVVEERGAEAVVAHHAVDALVLVHETVAVLVAVAGDRIPILVQDEVGEGGASRGLRIDGLAAVASRRHEAQERQNQQYLPH